MGASPSLAFSTTSQRQPFSVVVGGSAQQRSSATTTRLYASNEDDNEKKKKKGGLDTEVRNKLLSESIAPWRPLRLFLYGGLGSGAALGGFITLTGVIAGLSGARTDLDLNTEYLNLAIDFGAVAVFAVLAKFDLDKKGELEEKVADKVERKKTQGKLVEAMREREKQLGQLKVELQVTDEGDKTQAILAELQKGAKQHVIVVAGPRRACKEALIGAKFLQLDFAMSNLLVVPYATDKKKARSAPTTSGADGFGEAQRSNVEDQPFVAQPVGDGWEEYIEEEMKAAVLQGGAENPEEVGIAVVVASDGKVIRRGIGNVPWKNTLDQLNKAVNPNAVEEVDEVSLPLGD